LHDQVSSIQTKALPRNQRFPARFAFRDLAVLPPYNTLWTQAIRRGVLALLTRR
jgi:hypothetical protein